MVVTFDARFQARNAMSTRSRNMGTGTEPDGTRAGDGQVYDLSSLLLSSESKSLAAQEDSQEGKESVLGCSPAVV